MWSRSPRIIPIFFLYSHGDQSSLFFLPVNSLEIVIDYGTTIQDLFTRRFERIIRHQCTQLQNINKHGLSISKNNIFLLRIFNVNRSKFKYEKSSTDLENKFKKQVLTWGVSTGIFFCSISIKIILTQSEKLSKHKISQYPLLHLPKGIPENLKLCKIYFQCWKWESSNLLFNNIPTKQEYEFLSTR